MVVLACVTASISCCLLGALSMVHSSGAWLREQTAQCILLSSLLFFALLALDMAFADYRLPFIRVLAWDYISLRV